MMGGNQTLTLVKQDRTLGKKFSLRVRGRIENGKDSLNIQLSNKSYPEDASILLHIKPNENLIIYKWMRDRVWKTEELVFKRKIPVLPDEKFKVKIYKNRKKIEIFVNGKKICEFRHRNFDMKIDYLEITGDCIVEKIKLKFKTFHCIFIHLLIFMIFPGYGLTLLVVYTFKLVWFLLRKFYRFLRYIYVFLL